MRLIDWPSKPIGVRFVAGPAVVLLLLAFCIAALGANRSLFYALNGAGAIVPQWFWESVTHFGDALVASSLLVFVARRHPQVVWAALLAALLATVFTRGLKPLFDLPRPPAVLALDDFNLIGPRLNDDSFPSGHSSTIATLCGVLAIHTRSAGFLGCLLILTAVTGVSRVVVGVHWPLDVVFGWLGGWLSACAGSYLYTRRPFWQGRRAHRMQLGILLVVAVAAIGHDGGYPQAAWLSGLVGLLAAAMAALGLVETFRRPIDPRE